MKKIYLLNWLLIGMAMAGCYDDKGNYSYKPVNDITIEGLPEELSLRANVDTIKITPKVISALEGEIQGDHPDYSFMYRYIVENGTVEDVNRWTVLDSSFTKDLNLFANLLPRKYKCRFTVKDNRTGVETSASFKMNAGSVNREGWLVLCNEGEEQRVRLDMIGVLSESDRVVAYDLLKNNGLPGVKQAVGIGFQPTTLIGQPDYLWVLSKEGAFKLNAETFETGEEYNVRYEFGNQQANGCLQCIAYTKKFRLAIDVVNDGYYLNMGSFGGVYEFPFNTFTPESDPEFKLAPYILTDLEVRSYYQGYSAVVYDITNKRFLEWSEKNNTRCLPIATPEGNARKFDYTTGKELVHMEMTAYNGNTIYAVLKDEQGRYSLNSFTMLTNWGTRTDFRQRDSLALDLQGIEQATCFAFHSTQPYMFYAVGNVIYEFNLDTKNCIPVATLEGAKEQITLLKFNLFKFDYEGSKSKEYMNQQYDLIVGSVDTDNKTVNNGLLRFYQVPALSKPLEMKGTPYAGFGKIVDVLYRERK